MAERHLINHDQYWLNWRTYGINENVTQHLRNKGLNNIFVNEDLEKRQAEIYFHKRRAKQNNYIAKT